jgi:hypothetical protein
MILLRTYLASKRLKKSKEKKAAKKWVPHLVSMELETVAKV